MIEPSDAIFKLIAENVPEWFVDDEQLRVQSLEPTEALAAHLIHSPDWYALGYKAAADKLVSMDKVDWANDHALIYPIVFLYRHHLELQMKIIIERASDLVGRKNLPFHLDLVKLWELCAELLRSYWPNEYANVLDQIGKHILEFAAVERNASAFRYSDTKDGQLALGHIWKIDIEHLSAWVARRSDFFDFCIRRLRRRSE